MKKISALVLAIVLVCTMLSLASCKELTAYQVFHEAMEKTEALDSFECKANIDMAMKYYTRFAKIAYETNDKYVLNSYLNILELP